VRPAGGDWHVGPGAARGGTRRHASRWADGVDEGEALSATAEEFLTWLAVEHGRARNTLQAYRRDLRGYERFLAENGTDPEHATPAAVEGYLAAMAAAGRAPSTRARALAAIRGMHRFRLEEGAGGGDPTADVLAPRPGLRLPKALAEDEVLALLQAVPDDDAVSRRDRAIVELLYGTGMRVSELVGLGLGDLQGERRLVRVLGKGGKERLVPLGRHAALAVQRWLEPGGRARLAPARWARRGDADALFLNARGRRMTRQGVWGVLKRRAAAAGLAAKVHPHVLRHSCATHMLARGADIRVVQELLGHASVATTQLYTRVTLEHLRRVYEQAHPRAGRAGER